MSEKVMRVFLRRVCCLFFIVALWAAGPALAQEEEKCVRLRDGTLLRGTLVPSAEGVFRIKTRTLGEVLVDPADIASIESPGRGQSGNDTAGANDTAGGNDTAGRMEKLKDEIVNNPQVMASVEDLAQDEQIAALMSDEDLRAAIMSLDFDYLRKDEKFQAFTAHPGVQEIIGKVRHQDKGAGDER